MRKPMKAILKADYRYRDPLGAVQSVSKDTPILVSVAAVAPSVQDVFGNLVALETHYSVFLGGRWYQILPNEFALSC